MGEGPSLHELDLVRQLKEVRYIRWKRDEYRKLVKGLVDWDSVRSLKGLFWGVAVIVMLAIAAVIVVFHDNIITWFEPYARKLEDFKVGWLLPIILISILSIPPLGGQEIVIVLVGLIWGLYIGFAIAAAGTVIGETLNWFIFKRFFPDLADRETLLFLVLKQGGFWLCLATRITYIPTHLTTTLYAVMGFSFWIFMLAMLVSMPKQLVTIYAGVVIGKADASAMDKGISYGTAGASLFATFGVAGLIWKRMSTQRKSRLVEWKTWAENENLIYRYTPRRPEVNGAMEKTETSEV